MTLLLRVEGTCPRLCLSQLEVLTSAIVCDVYGMRKVQQKKICSVMLHVYIYMWQGYNTTEKHHSQTLLKPPSDLH